MAQSDLNLIYDLWLRCSPLEWTMCVLWRANIFAVSFLYFTIGPVGYVPRRRCSIFLPSSVRQFLSYRLKKKNPWLKGFSIIRENLCLAFASAALQTRGQRFPVARAVSLTKGKRTATTQNSSILRGGGGGDDGGDAANAATKSPNVKCLGKGRKSTATTMCI